MSRPRALDLFCGAGGVSEGLRRAGFGVVGVDINPQPHHRGGEFVQADAMELLKDRAFLRSFDFIHASPPCQRYTSLRHLTKGKEYPDLIAPVRFHLERSGVPWSIENVPGAPLRGNATLLCGTMFGLQTPDGRAEIRRHRLFETSFLMPVRPPACQHGGAFEALSVTGTGMGVGGKARWRERTTLVVTGHSYQGADAHSRRKRRAMSVTGNTPQTNLERNVTRETYAVADARAAMGVNWGGKNGRGMPMTSLSQMIPPAYAEWIGRQALAYLASL